MVHDASSGISKPDFFGDPGDAIESYSSSAFAFGQSGASSK